MELNRPGARLQARCENSKNKMDRSDGCYIKLEDKNPSLSYFQINDMLTRKLYRIQQII